MNRILLAFALITNLFGCKLNDNKLAGSIIGVPQEDGFISLLPDDKSTWANLVISPSITSEQIDEMIERNDVTPLNALLELSFKRSGITSAQRLKLSQTLNELFEGTVTNPEVTNAKAQELLWALVTTTLDTSGALRDLDISKIDFTEHNISEFDFSGCSNIPWATINNNSHPKGLENVNFSGLELSGFAPSASINLKGINLIGTTNIPWGAINTNIHVNGLSYAKLSGLNLAGFNPSGLSSVVGLDISNTTNVPWVELNTLTDYSGMNLSGLDLTNFTPDPTDKITSINYVGTTNIPWSHLNANATGTLYGLRGSNFSGQNMAGFNPPADLCFSSSNFSNTTNLNWTAINANAASWFPAGYGDYSNINFNGVNLSGFAPDPTSIVTGMILTGASNIPWANIFSTTYTNGLYQLDLSGLNLAGVSFPSSKYTAGINFANATNIDWTSVNNLSTYKWINFTGQNLASFNPGTTKDISGINYTNATNIPWTAINANTEASGIMQSIFSGVDLLGMNPGSMPMSKINFSGALNMPWAAISGNFTDKNGWNLSGLDLQYYNPSFIEDIYETDFTNATNITWSILNSKNINGANLSNLNLVNFNPGTTRPLNNINMQGAINIPWVSINANTNSAGYQGINIKNMDIRGFNPSGKSLNNAVLPLGARSKKGFEIATQNVPTTGTTFIDGTKPWGP